jgi:carbamoyl-phosphate synthase large subunit
MMKILITGVGGASGAGLAKVLRTNHYLMGVDANPHAPGKVLVDEFHVVPYASDKGYLRKLKALATGCDALFCTVDEELPIVAKNARKLGCKVLTPDFRAVENCLDKAKCIQILEKVGVNVPKTITVDKRKYEEIKKALGTPFVLKPRRGRGSRNINIIKNKDDYTHCKKSDIDFIAQEYLRGEEYTVDVLLDKKAKAIAIVPRKRVLTDRGVSIVGETVKNETIVKFAKKAAEALKLKYIVNVQMKNGKKRTPKITEINPRPAGTLPLTVRAGVNMPELALKIAGGKPISQKELKYESGIVMYRHWEEAFRRK